MREHKGHRLMYNGKCIPIKKMRYDHKTKTHVFVLDNDEGTILPVHTNIENLIYPKTKTKMNRSQLLDRIVKVINRSEAKHINNMCEKECAELAAEITEGVVKLLKSQGDNVENLFNTDIIEGITVVNISNIDEE